MYKMLSPATGNGPHSSVFFPPVLESRIDNCLLILNGYSMLKINANKPQLKSKVLCASHEPVKYQWLTKM